MNFLYRNLALSPGNNRERTAQQRWLKRRNACGSSAVCVRTAYIDRISHLLKAPNLKFPVTAATALGATSLRLRSGWVIDEELEPAISPCPELRDYMNQEGAYWWRSNNLYFTYCTGAAATSPVLESVPWKSLAPELHGELLVKLLRLEDEGARAYFRGAHQKTDEYYQKQARRFISGGGTMEVWSGHVFDSFIEVYASTDRSTQDKLQL